MQEFYSSARAIAGRIAESESRRKMLASFVRDISSEARLTKKVSTAEIGRLKVAGVDGGILKKSLQGMDCMLVRAGSACFTYNGWKVEKVEYWPSRNPSPKPTVFESASEAEWNQFSSLTRLKEEVSAARECMQNLSPDLLLMDGMLLPHYMDKPPAASRCSEAYNDVLSEFKSLFKAAMDSKVQIAGIVEDSRSTAFCEHLASKVMAGISHKNAPEIERLLKVTRDSSLLYLVLEKGERTLSFPSPNPLAAEFGMPPISTFYLKTAEFDRPIRVEFLPQMTTADALSGILLPISGHHSGYGIPAPIIEADNVAKLPESEMDRLYSGIISIAGNLPGIMELRRAQRPF